MDIALENIKRRIEGREDMAKRGFVTFSFEQDTFDMKTLVLTIEKQEKELLSCYKKIKKENDNGTIPNSRNRKTKKAVPKNKL